MSEEVEVTNDAPAAESGEQQVEERQKPAGYDPVDLNGLDPEIQKKVSDRFNYLYGQVKNQERSLHDFRSIASEQAKLLDELRNGMGTVVDHLHTQSVADSEAQLLEAMATAHEEGNTRAYIDAQDKLIELRAEKKFQEQQKKNQPKKAENQTYEPQGAPLINDMEQRVLDMWQSETDESGRQIRPWAYAEAGDDYKTALQETSAIFNSPRYRNWTIEQKLAEVDKRMGLKKASSGQNVMGGRLTTNNRNGKVVLTEQQRAIALRTKFGSNKGAKTDAEFIEAYRKQIESTKNLKQGARQ